MRLVSKRWHLEASDRASRKPLEHADLVARSQILQLKGRVRTARTGEPVDNRTVQNILQNVNTVFLQNPLQQVTPDSMRFTREDALEWSRMENFRRNSLEKSQRALLNRSRACDQRFLLGGVSSFSKNSAAISATCLCTASRSTPGLSTKNCGSCFFPASVPTSRNV